MRLERLEGKKIFTLDMYLDFIWSKDHEVMKVVEGKKDYAVDIGNYKYRVMPVGEGEFSPLYYRGQNYLHEPCKPSLYRENVDEMSLIKKYQFESLLKKLAIEKLANSYLNINNQYEFSIAYEGLCQHYELPTSLLDISKDPQTAEFFAMCELKDGKYYPREGGEGIIYTIDLSEMEKVDRNKIYLIGNQPLPRPKEQSGIAIKLDKHEDFNKQSFVSSRKIKFTKEDAVKIFNKFNGGSVLFPNDPIKGLIDDTLKTISNESILRYSKKYDIDFYEQFKKVLAKDFFVSNDFYANLLKTRRYKILFEEIENYIRSNTLDFGVRGWCEHFQR